MASSKSVVGYIGLGNMGSGMARNIALKADLDQPVLLFNRSPARIERLIAELQQGKAKAASSINELVKHADIIFTSLSDDNAVLETITTALKNDVKGKLFVDCSTVSGDTTTKIAKHVEDAGAGFVACPVFGAPLQAERAQLVCVPAGPSNLIDRVLPFCTGVIGRAVIPFPDHPPADALSLKCIGNSMLFNLVEALAEGYVISEKSGVGNAPFQKFIELFMPFGVPYAERMLNGVYYKSDHPPFSVDHARKDIGFAKVLAGKHGVPMKALEVADEHYSKVQGHMSGEKADVSSLYGAVRMESGLKFEA